MDSVAAAAGEREEEGAGQGVDARCVTLTQLVCCIYTVLNEEGKTEEMRTIAMSRSQSAVHPSSL